MVRISKFGTLQTAKFFAVFYAIITAIIFIPFAVVTMGIAILGSPDPATGAISGVLGGAFFLIAPVFYAVFGFVFVAISCWVYNVIAGFTGGIEIEIEQA